MDGHGIIYNGSVDAAAVGVGESRQFVAEILAPKATLRDPAGFDLYVSFELSEPASMSIAGLHGPYVKHFMAGNAAQIKAMPAAMTIPSRAAVIGGKDDSGSETVTVTAKPV
jgi:hypothetical protein